MQQGAAAVQFNSLCPNEWPKHASIGSLTGRGIIKRLLDVVSTMVSGLWLQITHPSHGQTHFKT